ncbi:MAG TPA: hypothetical protein VN713_12085 [Sphingomicrobium sp.]|nr:hypothetical protein [Sphingomicrobium sp.]
MADSVVHIGENSPEQVAYKLLNNIAQAEKKTLVGADANVTREWILRTYAQCLRTVNSPHNVNDYLESFGG